MKGDVLGIKDLFLYAAKDAKDAKVKGKKDEEIAGVAVEGAFALRIQRPCR